MDQVKQMPTIKPNKAPAYSVVNPPSFLLLLKICLSGNLQKLWLTRYSNIQLQKLGNAQVNAFGLVCIEVVFQQLKAKCCEKSPFTLTSLQGKVIFHIRKEANDAAAAVEHTSSNPYCSLGTHKTALTQSVVKEIILGHAQPMRPFAS